LGILGGGFGVEGVFGWGVLLGGGFLTKPLLTRREVLRTSKTSPGRVKDRPLPKVRIGGGSRKDREEITKALEEGKTGKEEKKKILGGLPNFWGE